MASIEYFGIRHHGPGCARSLLAALNHWQPDCLLLEGPPEAEPLLPLLTSALMRPPVALLGYCPDDPQRALYLPFAEFSPEWQAMHWALANHVPVRLMDLPLAHRLALSSSPEELFSHAASEDLLADIEAMPTQGDPLDWLALAAGDADGEAWWNRMVEERGDGSELFAAVNEAMTALRQTLGEAAGLSADDARREAYMRLIIREAAKAGYARIAVVCGAWHLAGLQQDSTQKADRALLKALPKVKIAVTWIPWTHRHLQRASGYGAGVSSPGWYEHVWHYPDGELRTVAWLSRIAHLMRERALDASSAHVIEAVRLTQTLAALRQLPRAGLAELQDAARSVFFLGDDTALAWIGPTLLVGDRLGQTPDETPATPLMRDLEKTQKTLRLKPEVQERMLALDLRKDIDLARSQLLHRLRMLGIFWGQLHGGQRGKGTFHEDWRLQWQPEFTLQLIEAGIWGRTLGEAAAACALDAARRSCQLAELAAQMELVLLADLPAIVPDVAAALRQLAALSGDASQLLAALPPLANLFRYGSVRGHQADTVAQLFDTLAVRAALALPLAAVNIDDDAAAELRQLMQAAHEAIALRDDGDLSANWLHSLAQLGLPAAGHHALLSGLAWRLRLDVGAVRADAVAHAMSYQLSMGNDPLLAAAWLQGFLNDNGMVLLHDRQLWQLLDDWLCALSDAHFIQAAPLVRRCLANFSNSERRELALRASQSADLAPIAEVVRLLDAPRAALPVAGLRLLMGISHE